MKSTIVAGLVGASLAAAAFLAAPALLPQQVKAADTNAGAEPPAIIEAKIIPATGNGQYKLLSLAPFQNDPNTQRMEDALNRLAADGWRVQTGVGIALVLSR